VQDGCIESFMIWFADLVKQSKTQDTLFLQQIDSSLYYTQRVSEIMMRFFCKVVHCLQNNSEHFEVAGK